ncbi:MAG: plasmid mobilization relaxosome protein MobC [Butyrivibrio sp.]|nr:plasmid mobilization relaxosome protein MobC [Butyrivibrio sp.]
MSKAKRKRNKAVTVRMKDSEYTELMGKVNESGLSQQDYIIRAIHGGTIKSAEEIAELKETNKIFANFVKQIRGMGTNLNQMAHVANGQGMLPTENKLDDVLEQIGDFRKEGENIWLLIRSSITLP